jgi:hypothetical protein
MRLAHPVAVALAIAVGSIAPGAGQPLKLDQVLSRLGEYLASYERRLALVVAEERYRQSLDIAPETPVGNIPRDAPVLPFAHQDRSLRSDYALTRAADKEAWVGYRDTFEVDGKPVRDRDDRLQRLLTGGAAAGGARIAQESSRFNLGNTLVERNVNVPTLVLEMLHPRNQSRFSFNKAGEETLSGAVMWRIEFKERERPTFIRIPNGRDRPSHGAVWLDPSTGEVWQTTLAWDSSPSGTFTVSYSRAPGFEALVQLTMNERYRAGTATITGDAAYSNYRQFQTGARLVAP